MLNICHSFYSFTHIISKHYEISNNTIIIPTLLARTLKNKKGSNLSRLLSSEVSESHSKPKISVWVNDNSKEG